MARIKLTQKFVNQCVANGQTQYFFDKIIPSFYIKVMPKGAISYHVRYQYQGERHSYHLGKASSISMDEARTCAIEKQAAQQGHVITDIDFITYGELFFKRYARHWKQARTGKLNLSIFNNKLVPEFGHCNVKDIDAPQVKRWLSKQSRKDHTPLALLSVMMKQAQEYGYRPNNSNPCKGLRKRNYDVRMRYLTKNELHRLWSALDNSSESPLMVILFRLLLFFPSLKSVPMSYAAVLSAWKRLRFHAELEDVNIHDLRHSYASFALQSGEHLLTIGQLLGHSEASTTLRYAHLAKEHVYVAAEKVSSQLARGLSL
jgi:integrase